MGRVNSSARKGDKPEIFLFFYKFLLILSFPLRSLRLCGKNSWFFRQCRTWYPPGCSIGYRWDFN